MNGFYNGYDQVIIETPEEREGKKRKVRRLFSRVFLALFIYIIISQLLSSVIYAVASFMMPYEQYLEFAESSLWAIIISSGVQYLIAFPIFFLALIGTKKAEAKERSRLSVKDFIIFFFIGEALMLIGSIIGNLLNEMVGALTGNLPENSIATLIEEVPMWLIVVLMVVIGPIVEELICRKLIIDRLSAWGDHIAILFSAVAFGLLHANLYQFFYAALLGALLGYVYTRTRDVRYTILLHMLFNFMGSIVGLCVEGAINEYYVQYELMVMGEQFDLLSLGLNGMITVLYSNLQYGMMAGGIYALVHMWKKRKFQISRDKELYLADGEIVKSGVLNVGSILFLILCLVLTFLNLILV
ncbi:MAG: CPBP family intramembrane metalloprotease [Clostridia bacterium]|nr:CPBP family intramembrane metalloprotease [Clostridia bacterium]